MLEGVKRYEHEISRIDAEIAEAQRDLDAVKSDIAKEALGKELARLKHRKERKEFALWQLNKGE